MDVSESVTVLAESGKLKAENLKLEYREAKSENKLIHILKFNPGSYSGLNISSHQNFKL